MTTTILHQTSSAPVSAVGSVRSELLSRSRWDSVRSAYTTRFVSAAVDAGPEDFSLLSGAGITPTAGDVVLARVTAIGKHTRLESPVSRRQLMFPGQEILVAYGNRYAPDQFLARVPVDLAPCHLVAGGGLAAEVLDMHASIDAATSIEPLGLLADAEGVVNLERFAPLSSSVPTVAAVAAVGQARPPVIAVLGTSMNSGKSTTLGCLVNGLSNAGLDVAAGKATGTGAGNDPNLFTDAGAGRVLDFTDYGHPTTYQLDYEQVRGVLTAMVRELSSARPDVVIIEIADGLYQGETGRLLSDPVFHATVDAVVFAAQDALGAVAGIDVLTRAGVPVSAVSGLLTASPLATSEAGTVLSVPVIGTYDLCSPETALGLLPEGNVAVAR